MRGLVRKETLFSAAQLSGDTAQLTTARLQTARGRGSPGAGPSGQTGLLCSVCETALAFRLNEGGAGFGGKEKRPPNDPFLPCFLPPASVFQDSEERKAAFYPFPAGKDLAAWLKEKKKV